jgi:hypothetical protein
VVSGRGFPFPKAEMNLPSSISQEKGTLTSVGGFEINNLMARQAHLDFYNNNYGYADELIHAFIQQVYFPFYAFIVAPARATKPSTRTDTRGDPVEFTLSTSMCPV